MKRGSVKPTGFWGRFNWRRFARVWFWCLVTVTVIIGGTLILGVYAGSVPPWQAWLYVVGGMTAGELLAEAGRTWRGE